MSVTGAQGSHTARRTADEIGAPARRFSGADYLWMVETMGGAMEAKADSGAVDSKEPTTADENGRGRIRTPTWHECFGQGADSCHLSW